MHLIDTLTIRTIDKYLYQQGRTKWTQLCYQEKVLCNSLEWVDPIINPVQVMLCETCGIEGCSSHGYVHISRMDDYVVWSPPRWDETIDLSGDSRLYRLDEMGSLLFPAAEWGHKVGSDSIDYPATTRRDLFISWLLDLYRQGSFDRWQDILLKLRQRSVRGSGLDHRAISSHLQQVISWFELAPDETLNGKLVLVDSLPAQVETIYLNDPPQEWYPFAIAGGQVFPAFGKEWLYLEES